MLLLRRFRGIALLSIALLLGVVLLATTSSGNFSNADDLLFFSERDGISMQQAQDTYGWHNDFSRAVEEVREVAPGTVAAARIEDGAGVLEFTGEVPPAAQNVIDAFTDDNPSVGVSLHANKGYTEAQIEAAVAAIHFALREDGDVRENVTYFHDASVTIRVEVQLRSTAPAGAISRLQEIADSKLTGLSGVTAAVSQVEHDGPLLVDVSGTKHWGR